jgi:hypothetical protein
MPAKEPAEAEARPTRRGGQVTAITLSGTQGLGRRGTFRVTDDMGAAIPRLRNPWLRSVLKDSGTCHSDIVGGANCVLCKFFLETR